VSAKPRVLIAGAGLGGLAAANALLAKGFDVEVYEQAPQLGEVGAGVQISPNGGHVMKALGLLEDLENVSSVQSGREIRLWDSGRTWKVADTGPALIRLFGMMHYTVHRADLHEIFVKGVERRKTGAIHLNARAAGFTQSRDGVILHLEDGRDVKGDVLIGADGVHSCIRQQMLGAGEPSFTGFIAWRGIAPAERLPEHLRRPVGTQWLAPGSHIYQYPLRRGALINMVGVVPRDDWRIESWSQRGTHEECLRDYAGWHEDAHALIRGLTAPFKWALMVREPLQTWSQGRVSLLGDACHSTLPFLAQGAVMSIEDAWVLARALEENRDVAIALDRYQKARIERTTRMVKTAAAQTERMHHESFADPARAEKFVAEQWNEEQFKSRYSWLYAYNAVTVPI